MGWYSSSGQRRQGSCASLKEAEDRAREINEDLKARRPEDIRLGSNQVAEFHAAQRIADLHARSILEAMQEWDRALDLLPEGVGLLEVLRERQADRASVKSVYLDEATRLYLEASAAKGNSHGHIKNQRGVLSKLADAFTCPLSEISRPGLTAWLKGLKGLHAKTRNDHAREVSSFLRWAQRQDFLAQNSRLFEALTTERITPKAIQVYSPTELWAILEASADWARPRIALIALAGARNAEAIKLTGADVKDGWIALDAHITKTKKRRAIPVCPALQEILIGCAPHMRKAVKGPTNSHASADKLFQRAYDAALRDAGVAKIANGLRHGFCSYRVAMTSDVAKTSLESGNSPAMIDRHYKAIVTKEQAKEWFRCDHF